MNNKCFPQPLVTGPCKAVPVVFLSTNIDGVDDGQYPPENGAYRNTIVTYTLTKHVYLYDSAGIPTRTNSEGIIDEAVSLTSSRPIENRAITKALLDNVESLQTNINLEVMARESDRDNLQTNINKEVETREEADQNLKTQFDSLDNSLDELSDRVDGISVPKLPNSMVYDFVSPAGANNPSTADNANITTRVVNTTTGTVTSTTLMMPMASSTQAGSITAEDKSKLDSLLAIKSLDDSLELDENGQLRVVDGENAGIVNVSYNADNVILNGTEIEAAQGTQEGNVGKAGIMSSFQASQLAALAEAYQAEEKGIILYEGTASVNNIELSESGFSYDHLIVVGQYMGMGSSALEQQVSAVFYPTDNIKAFQMNAIDLTVGDTPMETTYQDIWTITDDGMELELGPSVKCEKGAGTLTCTPEATSFFTITKVVGFGKKLLDQPTQS